MADVPDPIPVDGYAYKRPLGQFGKQIDDQSVQDDSEPPRLNPAFLRDLIGLVLILLAVAAITTGVTALLGWAWGLIVFGMMCAVIGVLLGITSSGPDSKDGAE